MIRIKCADLFVFPLRVRNAQAFDVVPFGSTGGQVLTATRAQLKVWRLLTTVAEGLKLLARRRTPLAIQSLPLVPKPHHSSVVYRAGICLVLSRWHHSVAHAGLCLTLQRSLYPRSWTAEPSDKKRENHYSPQANPGELAYSTPDLMTNISVVSTLERLFKSASTPQGNFVWV
jgi:hypothetical protein